MERVPFSSVLVLAMSCGLLAGCSGSDALGCAPAPSERSGESSAELVCAQAGFERADGAVATGILGTDVVEVTAAGQIRKVGPAAASNQPLMDNWWDIYERAGDDSPIYAPHQPESLRPLESLCSKPALLSDGRWAGTCAFHQDDAGVGTFYDLTTGKATELASFRSFEFL